MNQESVTHKRLWAWLSVAMSAPLVHFAGGSWLTLLCLGGIGWALTALVPGNWETIRESRVLCVIELIWLVTLLAQMIPLSAQYWPGRKSEIVVPLVLMALAAYSCTQRPSRVAGVLFWVLLILYLPVVAAGVKDLEPKWLVPKGMEISWWVVPVLLLPCGAKVLKAEQGGAGWYPGIVVFAVAMWLLTAGVLSPQAAADMEVPFRELSRSLTIGAASRFESLVSVTVTLGWFSFSSLLLRCASVYLEKLGVKAKYAPWLAFGAAVTVGLANVQLTGKFAAVIPLVLWVLLPILYRRKRSEKVKKGS